MQITPFTSSLTPSWLNSTSSIAKANPNAAVRTYSVRADSEPSTSSALQTLNTQGTLRARIKTLVEELRYHLQNPEKDVTAVTEVIQQVTKLEKSPAEQQVATTTPRVESRTTVTGRDDAQISNVQINSPLEANSTLTLRGQVTRAASAAKIVLSGGEHGLADSNSEFELLGRRGATYIDITAGESWQTVANRINGQKNITGVSAAVKDGKLELASEDVGGAAAIRLQPRNLVSDGITGQNDRQITSVAVPSQVGGTREEIGGIITSSAQRAEVKYQGTASGKVGGSASFRLSGVRGDVRISVTAGESLADVAKRINQHQDATGVVATVAETKLVLASDTTGAAATVRVSDVQSGNAITTSGVNSSQFSNFSVGSVAANSERVLSGQVLRSASQATLKLQGTTDGSVAESAAYELSGSLGTANFSVHQGESLGEVAARVNDLSKNTGVTARVEGSQLLFQSTELGSAAEVRITRQDVSDRISVTGVNSQQVTSFQVDSLTPGSLHSINGRVTQLAEKARLTSTGLDMKKPSTFTLSGNRGSVEITTTSGQSLESLAAQVNEQTEATGVEAVVSKNKIDFLSVEVGSDAIVSIDVSSGKFNVQDHESGGDSAQRASASGSDAVAILNGQTITATGNTFRFSDARGTYSLTTAEKFSGTLSTISIASEASLLNVLGGDGAGFARGEDAVAEINGVQVTGRGNQLEFSDAAGAFQFEVAAGFQGTFDPITVHSQAAAFKVDADGSAAGTDFVATINGREYSSATNQVTVQGTHGNYGVTFAADFVGEFDTFTVSKAGRTRISGVDESGRAVGSNVVATINGQEFQGQGNKLRVVQGKIDVTLDLETGFAGELGELTIKNITRTLQTEATTSIPTESVKATTHTIIAQVAGSSPARLSFQQVLEEIDELLAPVAASASPKRETKETVETETATPLTKRQQLVSRIFESLSKFSSSAPTRNYSSLAAERNREQRLRLLDLLA